MLPSESAVPITPATELEPDPELLPVPELDPALPPVSAPASPVAPVEPPHADHETRTGAASSDRIARARREGVVVTMRGTAWQ
jgi:hypothetical protein